MYRWSHLWCVQSDTGICAHAVEVEVLATLKVFFVYYNARLYTLSLYLQRQDNKNNKCKLFYYRFVFQSDTAIQGLKLRLLLSWPHSFLASASAKLYWVTVKKEVIHVNFKNFTNGKRMKTLIEVVSHILQKYSLKYDVLYCIPTILHTH